MSLLLLILFSSCLVALLLFLYQTHHTRDVFVFLATQASLLLICTVVSTLFVMKSLQLPTESEQITYVVVYSNFIYIPLNALRLFAFG
jgi:hypothetical protein